MTWQIVIKAILHQRSLRWGQTLLYLLLRDEDGALTVHRVVGEVVGEGLDSLPHRLACDGVRALWRSYKSMIVSMIVSVCVCVREREREREKEKEIQTFTFVMEVSFPSILMMQPAVRSFSLE